MSFINFFLNLRYITLYILVFEIKPRFSYFSTRSKRTRKRKCFVGDVTDEDFRTPKQGKFVFSIAKRKIAEQKKALQALRMKNRRLRQKISDLSGLLNSLREMNFISDNAQDHIEVSENHRSIFLGV